MSLFKCKMCGGTIEFEPGATVGVCDSCGTKQTLPKLDDDRRANLYDRANHFRRNNEFDKAAGIYEQILNEDTTDAEAYWSLVLCEYGIEYVEDPSTHKRIPTVNRAQFTSIYDDDNYKSALQYSDAYQRILYEQEANEINEIQKGILAISQKEEPFDVFICYKETDPNGRRTLDSVLANDLYHQLVQEGFKVFFSKITLEDKLGTAYEPYIFAALNSAKVMVVLGTKPEYFNAVWVKNEWSRFLTLVKKSGGKKVLIPAYKDMDPYDLPEEFSHLQAQDMSKLGFMQDLIRGINKIAKANEEKQFVKETVVVGSNSNFAPLFKRINMFLSDGDWKKADDLCEQVLNQDPENAQAYLGKLMAELHVRKQEALADCEQPLEDSYNYQKAVLFDEREIGPQLIKYNKNTKYNQAVQSMRKAEKEDEYKSAASLFKMISGYKDADTLAEKCFDKAEGFRKDGIYHSARLQMNENTVQAYLSAIKTFNTIPGWRDTNEQIASCQRNIELIKEREEKQRLDKAAAEAKKKKKKILLICTVILGVLLCVVVFVYVRFVVPEKKYNNATVCVDNNDYDAAYDIYSNLNYKDSAQKAIETMYAKGEFLISQEKYDEAVLAFESIPDYLDSNEKIEFCQKEARYHKAIDLYNQANYEDALAHFSELSEELDVEEWIEKTKYEYACACLENKDYETAVNLFSEIIKYEDSSTKLNEAKYQTGVEKISKADYYSAYEILNSIFYKDSVDLSKSALYNAAEISMDEKDYAHASEYYQTLSLKGYKDSADKYKEAKYLLGCKYLNEKKYDFAIACFSATVLSNYRDSDTKYKESTYLSAKDKISRKKYDGAVTILEKMGDYKDSADLIKDAKYKYVKANYTKSSMITFQYLKSLLEEKYLDSEALYVDLYSWRVAVVVNKNEFDETSNYSSLSVAYEDSVYFHIKVTGGTPGEKIRLKYSYKFGNSGGGNWDFDFYDGSTSWFSVFQFQGSGDLTYSILTESGIKLATGKVRIN